MLQLDNLIAGYQSNIVLHGVTLDVPRESIVTIVGPNGCGKSTILRAIYGLIEIKAGNIKFEDENINHFSPDDLLKRGIAMVPQLSSIFRSLTVEQNLELGFYIEKARSIKKNTLDNTYKAFPVLHKKRKQKAGTLSGGERRSLEIARALLLNPRFLILDEPSVGLSPALCRQLFRDICTYRDSFQVTVLMVEQNAKAALEISDYGYVIQRGYVSHYGTGTALLNDDEVRLAFLGG